MIRIRGLNIDLTGFSLKNIDLNVRPGEFFALLGPTGSGKTLILESVAGVAPRSRGGIEIDGVDVSKTPPEQRDVGIVYQDAGLFPHLTVRQNVEYGLKYRNKGPEGKKWAAWLMDRMGIARLAHRSIENLSGGEKQRTALARALSVRPKVLLLDEPLSALDPSFREDLRNLLKELHEQLSVTCLMVTHDFSEALFLSQRAALIHNGSIEQTGSVTEIFNQPASPFAANFVGMKNIFRAKAADGVITIDGLTIKGLATGNDEISHAAVRPEHLILKKAQRAPTRDNCFPAVVKSVVDYGAYCEVLLKLNGLKASAAASKSEVISMGLVSGDQVCIEIRPEHVHVF